MSQMVSPTPSTPTTATKDAGVRLAHNRLDLRGVAAGAIGRTAGGLLWRIDALVRERDEAVAENARLTARVKALERKLAADDGNPDGPVELGDVKLTDRQRETYDAIVAFWQERGYSPTIRDIIRATAHVSTSVVIYTLKKLRKLDLIDYDDRVARSITVAGATWAGPARAEMGL